MTDKLTTLMHERADAVELAPPDVDTLTRDGDRTVRRRRSLAVIGGVAAVTVLATGVALLPGTDGAVDGGPASGPADGPSSPTWVTGSTLHLGPDRTVDLGREVTSYVRTGYGYVFVDRTGTVWSWRDGTATDVGRTDRGSRLVADADAGTAAFVDGPGTGRKVVVVDQLHDATAVLDPDDETEPVRLYGLDGGRVFWRDARGIVAADVDGDAEEVLASGLRGVDLSDVEAGVFAAPTGEATVVGTVPGEGQRLEEAYGSLGALSPDGHFYSSEGDEPAVFDTRSGERVDLDLTQRFATGYEWLDETTLAVLAADRPRQDATAQLLTCTVPDGGCRTVVDDLGTFTELQGRFALPVGEPTG